MTFRASVEEYLAAVAEQYNRDETARSLSDDPRATKRLSAGRTQLPCRVRYFFGFQHTSSAHTSLAERHGHRPARARR